LTVDPTDGWLKTKPKIAASNFSMRFQCGCHPFDGGRWDDEHLSSQAEYDHTERAARRVECYAAFAGAAQGQIKFDSCIDLTPSKAAPRFPYE